MTPNVWRALALTAVVFAASSCGGDSSTAPQRLAGTYTLRTVNGTAVPATFTEVRSSLRINSGSIVINSGSTFSRTANYTTTLSGQSTTTNDVCAGTYTQNGNSISFDQPTSSNPNCGGAYNGTWTSGNTLTVRFDASNQAVFQK